MIPENTSSTERQTLVEDREAVIFIPAIGKEWDDPSIDGVARRMALAVDRQSATEKAKVHIEVAEKEYGTGYKCKMFTIVKRHGKTSRPLIDVFGLDYNDTLVEVYAKRNLFIKTILLAITLLGGFRRLLFRFYKKSKSVKEKLQLTYGLMVFGLLLVYLAILVAAVFSSVEQLSNTASEGTRTVEPERTIFIAPQTEPNPGVVQQKHRLSLQLVQLSSLWDDFTKAFGAVWGKIKDSWYFVMDQRKFFPAIIVWLTALGFVFPSLASVKENISLAATNYLCMIHYLNWGERGHAIGGKLESILEYIVERENVYRNIHIIGYSFGSIVAIDNLFPSGRKPIERFKRIDTLITIGCPFDLVRTYWPDYFKGRQSLSPDKPKWLNVYSPIDILSSNFADGGNNQKVDEAEQQDIGVEVEDQMRKPENVIFSQGPFQTLGVIDMLRLMGFKAHTMYWGEEFKGEITCFHDIVKKMYQGTPVLK